MKSKAFPWAAGIVVLALMANVSALAQQSLLDKFEASGSPIQFWGLINAYSPQTGTTGTLGPYEVRGSWSLTVNLQTGKGQFYAAVNMELSDGWELTTNKDSSTLFDPVGRNAHTHHIIMTTGEVTKLAGGGIQVTGPGTVTLNGGATPFAQQSTLTIKVTGGTTGIEPIEFSNMTLLFGSPASSHFGTVPLAGVVQGYKEGD